MNSQQREVATAFLDGMYELFDIMFTNHIKVSLLDEERTDVNIYGESEQKFYKEPVEILGKVEPSIAKLTNPKMGYAKSLKITVPTKSLTLVGIDITPNGYAKMRRAKITFEGVDYFVNGFNPKTLVAETYLFFEINCSDSDILI